MPNDSFRCPKCGTEVTALESWATPFRCPNCDNTEVEKEIRKLVEDLEKRLAPKVRCPRCDGKVTTVESWSKPFWCPQCDAPINRERLLIQTETRLGGKTGDKFRIIEEEIHREIGTGGRVLWEYHTVEPGGGAAPTPSRQVTPLLLRILEMQDELKNGSVYLHTGQNLKHAKQRFKRWFKQENRGRPLEFDDVHLQKLASDLLAETKSAATPASYSAAEQDRVEDIFLNHRFDDLEEYERRKAREISLIATTIPERSKRLIAEAQEAYRWELDRATCAICRVILEDFLRTYIDQNFTETAAPIRDQDLNSLINCLDQRKVDSDLIKNCHVVREFGNRAAHDGDVDFSDVGRWILFLTVTLIRDLQKISNSSDID
jgi:transcription initiation factor IIE alpha subunit